MVKLRFQLFSDIHIELANRVPKIPALAPYLFLAGDIGKINHKFFDEFASYCNNNWKKIFYVCGNHEYYSSNKTHEEINTIYKNYFSNFKNIVFLDDSIYSFEEFQVNIYGSTLWSQVTETCGLNDFNMIKMKNSNNWTVSIDKEYFNKLHDNSLKNLVNVVKNTDKKLIVISHFPPLRKTKAQGNLTSHKMYESQPEYLANYFANNLTNEKLEQYEITEIELFSKVKLWVSGHTHYSYDFEYIGTRCLSNQIGYIGEQDLSNPKYDGVFEIDLD